MYVTYANVCLQLKLQYVIEEVQKPISYLDKWAMDSKVCH